MGNEPKSIFLSYICCGTENKVGSTTCTECKAVLSTAGLDALSQLNTVICEPGSSRPPEEPKMTRNIQSLFDGAERYIEGSIQWDTAAEA